jgi:hypothetical protein
MALTRDFRVKDSLNVGVSGLFKAGAAAYDSTKVAIDTFGRILSGGRDLSTVFANITLANLTQGSGIVTFSYNGGSTATIAVAGASTLGTGFLTQWNGSAFASSTLTDASLVSLRTTTNTLSSRWESTYTSFNSLSSKYDSSYATTNTLSSKWDSTYSTTNANSANWNTAYAQGVSVYSAYSAASGTIIDDVTVTGTQGAFNVVELDGGSVTRNLTNLGTTGTPTFAGLTVNGGLSAVALSGDGSALTNLNANAIFPGALTSDLVGATKIFVNDGVNKYITFTAFLNDLFGEGLAISSEKLILKNAAALSNNTITYWDDSNGQLVNSVITQSGGAVSVGGSLTANGNFGVTGTTFLNGALIAVGNVTLGAALTMPASGTITIGDANLYRSAADTLKTDDSFIVGANLTVNGNITLGDTNTDTLTINAGPINFPNATTIADALVLGTDVTLYRDSANTLRTNDSLIVDGNTTIAGNLTVQGTTTQLDTVVSVTSALSVINTGTGPAFYAEQSGTEPIAVFVDRQGGTITFSDSGSIGVGTPAGAVPSEKLSVVGSISASGTLKLGGLAAGTTNSVVIDSSGTLQNRTINSGVWSTAAALISGTSTRTANTVPKFSDASGITNSTITDNGDDVTIGGNVIITSPHRVQQYSEGGVTASYTNTRVFAQSLSSGVNTVTTFAKADVESARYVISLSTGSTRTAFETLIVYNGTEGFGTVYAIIDAQATSLLSNVDVTVASTTIDLAITTTGSCIASIHGVAQRTVAA